MEPEAEAADVEERELQQGPIQGQASQETKDLVLDGVVTFSANKQD